MCIWGTKAPSAARQVHSTAPRKSAALYCLRQHKKNVVPRLLQKAAREAKGLYYATGKNADVRARGGYVSSRQVGNAAPDVGGALVQSNYFNVARPPQLEKRMCSNAKNAPRRDHRIGSYTHESSMAERTVPHETQMELYGAGQHLRVPRAVCWQLQTQEGSALQRLCCLAVQPRKRAI